jgi:hypothetical protein
MPFNILAYSNVCDMAGAEKVEQFTTNFANNDTVSDVINFSFDR